MRTYPTWSALGVLLVACGGQSGSGEEETLGASSQALQCRDNEHDHGHGHGHGRDHGRPKACAFKRDAAFPLGLAACQSSRLVGSAVREDALAADVPYRTLLGHEFSYVTPENSMKWGSLQPVDAKHWDFTQADQVVAAAKAAHQAVKGHALVWHQQLPPFVSDALSAKELKRAMERHIEKVVGRYRADIRAWDVVNEAVADDGALRDSVFSRKFGDTFIAEAFERAHDADPNAELFTTTTASRFGAPRATRCTSWCAS
jgi:endo-1,4-beta-xylanase